jgi:hypothetical protein
LCTLTTLVDAAEIMGHDVKFPAPALRRTAAAVNRREDKAMTLDEALDHLPPELRNTYRSFINDYVSACKEVAKNMRDHGEVRPYLEKGLVHHEVFIEVLKTGRWRKIIPSRLAPLFLLWQFYHRWRWWLVRR